VLHLAPVLVPAVAKVHLRVLPVRQVLPCLQDRVHRPVLSLVRRRWRAQCFLRVLARALPLVQVPVLISAG
jgi:hypothetical protein